MASLEGYGAHVFKGAVAAPYLARQGLPPNTLESADWAKDARADKVNDHSLVLKLILSLF